jgi:HEAT repeat protein
MITGRLLIQLFTIAGLLLIVQTPRPSIAAEQPQSSKLDAESNAYLAVVGYCRLTFGIVPEFAPPPFVMNKQLTQVVDKVVKDINSTDRISRRTAMRVLYHYGLWKRDVECGNMPVRPCYGQYTDRIHSLLTDKVATIEKEEFIYASTILLCINRNDDRAMTMFQRAMNSHDYPLRKDAYRAVGVLRLTTKEIMSPLLAALNAKDPDVVHAAVESLTMLGADARITVPDLVQLIKRIDKGEDHQRHVSVRQAAVRAIGRLGVDRPETLVELLPVLRGKTREEMIAGLDCLTNMGQCAKPAGTELKKLLADDNYLLRLSAARTLACIDCIDQDVINVLHSGLRDQSREVRLAAAAAVARVGPRAKSCVPLLISLLRDDDVEIRLASSHALGCIGAEASQAIPSLRELFAANPEDFRVPRTASTALSRIGSKALPTLTAIVKDPSSDGRDSAAFAIGLMRSADAEAITALLDALASPDDAVRSCSAVALGRIGKQAKRSMPLLDKLRRKDASMHVRILANWAYNNIAQGP